MKKRKILFCLLGGFALLLFPLVFLLRGFPRECFYSEQRLLLGTVVEILVSGAGHDEAAAAAGAAFAEIQRVESVMSRFAAESELSRVNREAARSPVPVSAEIVFLLEQSEKFSRLTGGAFDVTATSLGQKDGYREIILNPTARTVFFRNPRAQLDLDGIATGYAVDRATAVLEEKGIANFLINAGGDIRARGQGRRGTSWLVAVQDPFRPGGYLGTLRLTGQAVTTSGNYLRPHIIDPRTGLPAGTAGEKAPPAAGENAAVLSSTVLAPDCLTADALATALYILGPEAGMKLAGEVPGVEILVATGSREKEELCRTPGFPFTPAGKFK